MGPRVHNNFRNIYRATLPGDFLMYQTDFADLPGQNLALCFCCPKFVFMMVTKELCHLQIFLNGPRIYDFNQIGLHVFILDLYLV